ncbi:MAG TPA: geranylgeranylglyceryl/heptaprenylglyceryl phosphate synthase [Lutibacter sp.]|nr:geranylgeranylglyceryl/heptaprenylglyceryl phosphate synthase [Lutibacter sp.]
MNKKFANHLQVAKKNKEQLLAILLDPDKLPLDQIHEKAVNINKIKVDYILVGGSLLFTNLMDSFILELKKHTNIPIILFPGNAMQISNHADGILFLSLLSGRNSEFLIGNQVIAAPLLKQTKLEIISTSYLLIESGRETTASYISNTKPIPRHKSEIAMATALAGEMMGHQITYLDGGSGAQKIIPKKLIEQVAKHVNNPIIVGGGIQTRKQLNKIYKAGATLVVIGNAFENDNLLLDNL